MNLSTITVFVEWILLIALLIFSRLIKAHSCTTIKRQDGILENCSYRGLILGIPQDLNPEVTEIDFTGNYMKNLATGGDFEKYTKLRVLIMRNVKKQHPFSKSKNLFKNMNSLEVIDFSYAYWEDSEVDFPWPPNIRIIYVSDNKYLKDLALENLQSLEKLYASGITDGMKNFPKFHQEARIDVLDLKDNGQIEDLSTDMIAPLCHLQHLNITVNLELTSYCECKKLRSWANSHQITLGSPMHCGSPSPEPKCDLKFSQSQQQHRRNCIGRGLSSKTSSSWYKILPLVFLIVLSLLIPSYIYVKMYRKAHQKSQDSSIESISVEEEQEQEIEDDVKTESE